MSFINRQDAGRRLAEVLATRSFDRPVVIALPRGGVPVAGEVATALDAPLDVLVVRKLGYPSQPELGIGAIAEGGVQLLNEPLIAGLGVTREQLDGIIALEEVELRRRVRRYRGDRPATCVSGRTVILIDDGLATGFTVRVAVDVLRQRGAYLVVVAVPVGPADTVHDLRSHADQVISLRVPTFFVAVGHWYLDYTPVDDAEVARTLAERASVPAGVR